MKNLKLTSVNKIDLGNDYAGLRCLTVDCMRNIIYSVVKGDVIGFSLETHEVIHCLHICGDDDTIVGIDYMIDIEELCIATANGELHAWNPYTSKSDLIGNVVAGITSISWSPDFEVAVLTTGDHKFVLLTNELEPVLDGPIHSQEFGEATSVNVGWGKKETQFHGSAGKPTQGDLRPPDVNPVFKWDDRRSQICWHGDGSCFAINAVEPETGIRKIRIWSKEGVLFSTNEAIDGLEQAIFWRPSGGLLASTQRRPNKHEVIFFEKNGLRHGGFSLPFRVDEVKVVEVAWNGTSDMLALWLEKLPDEHGSDPSETKDLQSSVQVWTTGNYHWYLKQELAFGTEGGEEVTSILWDTENSGKLHVICKSGKYFSYCWTADVFHSVGLLDNNMSTVAVIDGKNALLTPFKVCVTPPPMAAQTIKFESTINQLSLGPGRHCNSFAAILANGCLVAALAVEMEANNLLPKYQIRSYGRISRAAKDDTFIKQMQSFEIHHLIWCRDNLLLCAMPATNDTGSFIIAITFADDDGTGSTNLLFENECPFPDGVYAMCRSADSDGVLIQANQGAIYKYKYDDGSVDRFILSSGKDLTFPLPCPKIVAVSVDGEEIVFGLSQHYRLYVNGIEIINNCTSFDIHEEFLVLTTHDHKCRCILLSSLLQVISNNGTMSELEEGIRATERGSKIVVPVINDSKVVLQMPRGNLETIHPRALVISSLKKMLDSLRYKEAVVSMKRHRINLNLLCDHNKQLFLDNIEIFITQVESVNDLNLFLADLSTEDVTTTLYRPYYKSRKNGSTEIRFSETKNLDEICTKARSAFERLNPDKYTLCILTTYVRQSNKDLESALVKIKEVRDHGTPKDDHKWEKALKYLLYLVDVNEIYNVALGLYDFDLVLMVAEKSQKDPKEYLAYLNSLKKMEPNYRKYSIDMDLKRYKKALHHVAKAGRDHFGKCLHLVISQRLYQDGLSLYEKDSEEYKEIAKAYGEYLSEQKKHIEAGMVFARCKEHRSALESFRRACHWTLAIKEALALQLQESELSSLCRRLSGDLKIKGRYSEAAYLLEVYCKDAEEAIMALIEGHLWMEALTLIQRFQREDIMETNFRPCLLEEFKNILDLTRDKLAQFLKYEHRLEIVREEKKKREEAMAADDNFHEDAANDLFSDVSSITGQSTVSTSSKSSRSSGHSSKSRRKVQRKKYSLKEGSKYEDFALMEALAELVNTVDKIQDDVKNTIQALAFFDYEKEAETLQGEFGNLFKEVSDKMEKIWRPKDVPNATPLSGPGASVNSIIASMAANQSSSGQWQNPDLPEPTRAILRKDVKWKLSIVWSLEGTS